MDAAAMDEVMMLYALYCKIIIAEEDCRRQASTDSQVGGRRMLLTTIKTGKVVTRIMSVRQRVFGERRLSNGGKVETLIILFHLTTKEANHSFYKYRF